MLLGFAAAIPAGTGRASAAARPEAEPCDDACLAGVFGDFGAPDPSSERDIFLSKSADTISYGYGTIRPRGVRTLLGYLQLRPSDVFTDVGSGVGNVVLQVHANTPARRVRGIELLQARHAGAVRHLEALRRKVGLRTDNPAREVLLVNRDACKEDYSDSTVVFSTSTLFSEEVMQCLKASCEGNPNLRYLVTQQPLPPSSRLRYLGEVPNVQTSWSPGEAYRIYSNVPGTTLPPARERG